MHTYVPQTIDNIAIMFVAQTQEVLGQKNFVVSSYSRIVSIIIWMFYHLKPGGD